MNLSRRVSLFPSALLVATLAACGAQPDGGGSTDNNGGQAVTESKDTVSLTPDACKKPGAFVGGGKTPSPAQVALDAYCGEQLLARSAPQGWVVMFGSSRLKDGTPEYDNAKSFASQWTTAHGKAFPIMTAAGPGIMEAGNRGAKEAGGPSLGAGTYFSGPTDAMNTFVTDGYMFSDFETRERALLRYAKAAVIYWGGVGTAWELFMTISDVQTKRLGKIPIILVGKDWTDSVMPFFQYMVQKGTISQDDVNLFQVVESPEDTVSAIEAQLQ